MNILVIAEHDNNNLKAATLNTLAAAQKFNGEIDLFIAGHNHENVITEAQSIDGLKQIISVNSEIYKNFLAEDIANIVSSIESEYDCFLAPSSTFGKNFMPRVAAKIDTQMISDIIEVVNEDTFKRPIYAGSCIATVKSNDSKKVITVRTTSFDPITTNNSEVPVKSIDALDNSSLSSFVGEELAESDRPELTSASIVVSGGRGMQSGDNFHLLDSIADKLGAAVGASRAAVDSGFVPNDYQVGQTGKIVAPDLYIAVGISGAIQHLAGMKDSKVIVAINKDEDAPIFQVADYGLVADLFNALPEIDSKL